MNEGVACMHMAVNDECAFYSINDMEIVESSSDNGDAASCSSSISFIESNLHLTLGLGAADQGSG